jgi:hypothetical protein
MSKSAALFFTKVVSFDDSTGLVWLYLVLVIDGKVTALSFVDKAVIRAAISQFSRSRAMWPAM